jgi:hypothetical protein
MKTKRTLTIAAVLVALASFLTLGFLRGTRPVQAQDTQPPPQPERISFGMVGITRGQTIRLNVVNAIPYDAAFPAGPTRVVLTFLDTDGQRVRNLRGTVIRRAVDLEPGRATFLDLNADDLQFPPGPTRLQLRAIVNTVPPPTGDINEQPPPIGDRIVTSVEVFNNANGRTVLFIGNPGVIRGFNPQPDPPL